MLLVLFFVVVSVIPAMLPFLWGVPWLVWGIPGIIGLYAANRALVRWGNRQAGF